MKSKTKYRANQIAAICDVGFRTVARWLRRGILAHTSLPKGGEEITKEELLQFIDAKKIRVPAALRREDQFRVLIVEDDLHMAHAIERTLLRLGFETKIAAGAHEAGQILLNFSPHIMTVDLKMHGIGGHDLLRLVKNLGARIRTKVIVISGESDIEVLRALQLGCHGFLRKPFLPDQLKDVIRNVFGSAA